MRQKRILQAITGLCRTPDWVRVEDDLGLPGWAGRPAEPGRERSAVRGATRPGSWGCRRKPYYAVPCSSSSASSVMRSWASSGGFSVVSRLYPAAADVVAKRNRCCREPSARFARRLGRRSTARWSPVQNSIGATASERCSDAFAAMTSAMPILSARKILGRTVAALVRVQSPGQKGL
jgi:hypothetical protein